ncbi:MAG: GatB/YqeY domain-containing protein [Paludibacteraceae bacterium]|nr:GatB/YqeY domain-containing protein [Paludibacteraceae bacterium]
MALFVTISEDIKRAMLAKDKVALDALRGIKKEFLEAKTAPGGANLDADGELRDDKALQILQKLVKQRKESAEMYVSAGRQELANEELAQCHVIEQYLPAMMSEAELEAALKTIIAQVGATGPQDMGKVMGTATKALAGKAEGRMISAKVKELLAK